MYGNEEIDLSSFEQQFGNPNLSNLTKTEAASIMGLSASGIALAISILIPSVLLALVAMGTVIVVIYAQAIYIHLSGPYGFIRRQKLLAKLRTIIRPTFVAAVLLAGWKLWAVFSLPLFLLSAGLVVMLAAAIWYWEPKFASWRFRADS